MNKEEESVIQTYRQYIKAYESLDFKTIANYFHYPFMHLTESETQLTNSRADFEDRGAAHMAEALKGLTHVDIREIYAHQMSKDLCFISTDLDWHFSNRKDAWNCTYTYTLRKMEDGWKIAVAMMHDKDKIMRHP